MTVAAPPRPPGPSDPLEHEELEALIEEARRRARRRRLVFAVVVASVTLGGAALFTILARSGASQTASPRLAARTSVPAAAARSTIAFVRFPASRPGGGALYVVNADGSGERLLARNARVYAWSPDHRRLAFLSGRFEVVNGNLDIHLMNADGSGQVRLTRGPEREEAPRWSPDGRTISFVGWTRSGRTFAIYVMNADGSGTQKLTGELVAQQHGFVWSPDGRKIAFRRLRDGNSDVWVMNSDGTGLLNLTRSPQNEFAGEWSPDGRKLIVYGGSDGEILVVNADGSGMRRLLLAGDPSSVAWSPDGRELAIASVRQRDYVVVSEVSLMNADGSGLRRLARHQGKTDPFVAWSPDGRTLAFTSGRDGNSEIYVMNADGTGLRRLTRNRAWEQSPVWAPGRTP